MREFSYLKNCAQLPGNSLLLDCLHPENGSQEKAPGPGDLRDPQSRSRRLSSTETLQPGQEEQAGGFSPPVSATISFSIFSFYFLKEKTMNTALKSG